MSQLVIDLRKQQEPLRRFIAQSLAVFADNHVVVPVCTAGLWCDAFHGDVTFHLDTPEHSSAFVEKQFRSEFPWFGRDAQGTFCKDVMDMEHRIGEYRFPGYPDFIETDEEPIYITLDGAIQRCLRESGEGDEGYDRILHPFLERVFRSFRHFPS